MQAEKAAMAEVHYSQVAALNAQVRCVAPCTAKLHWEVWEMG